jgi:SAM-dependent methyltransferase
MMTQLSAEQIARNLSSYVDPGGILFSHGGRILRAIRPEFAEFYRSLLTRPVVQQMLGREIIETKISMYELEGYPLVLEHRPISPLNFCFEWTPQMLRDAAILTLNICLQLAEEGLVLQDAYPWNIIFDGPRPVFVDYTSITLQEKDLVWVAYQQFCNFFLYPLYLSSFNMGHVARSLLHDYINGITDDLLVHLLPTSAPLCMPRLIGQVYLPRVINGLVRALGREEAVKNLSARLNISQAARVNFFRSLLKTVESIPLKISSSDWSGYYSDIHSFTDELRFDRKQAMIHNILRRHRPSTVVDIGCNQGGYSIMAAQMGARVVAFDTDEQSVAMLYQHARDQKLDILPLIMDVINPSPACGWRAEQFLPANKRFSGEMAFALALVHHLAFTQRQSFERIAAALADYTPRWLVAEFVPIDDEKSVKILVTNRRDLSWYTLDNFLASLQQYFNSIELLESSPSNRTLILCER